MFRDLLSQKDNLGHVIPPPTQKVLYLVVHDMSWRPIVIQCDPVWPLISHCISHVIWWPVALSGAQGNVVCSKHVARSRLLRITDSSLQNLHFIPVCLFSAYTCNSISFFLILSLVFFYIYFLPHELFFGPLGGNHAGCTIRHVFRSTRRRSAEFRGLKKRARKKVRVYVERGH